MTMAGGRPIEGVEGRGIPLGGDDIDTDRIIPARFLRCVTFEGLGDHVFEDDRKPGGHPFDDPRYEGAAVLVVNRNFGCGSSREHAPEALAGWGIRAVVAESFAEIFLGNATARGMVCLAVPRDEIGALQEAVEADPGLVIEADVAATAVRFGDVTIPASIPASYREALLSGDWDAVGGLLAAEGAIASTEGRLPYLREWAGKSG